MTYLLDTGFFFALLNKDDSHHAAVTAAAAKLHGDIYLPTVVTTEIAYLVRRDLGAVALAQFIDGLAASQFLLAEPTQDDFLRAGAVVRQYADSQIDFVGAIMVAMAERMNITQILTIDARHFRLFRPKHTPAFTIIP